MGIEEQIDRLIDLGEEIRDSLNHLKVVRLRDALRAAGPKVFDAVADEPAKEPEPEHPPDPGEGYRILSKNPPEELMPGDELHYINGTWVASDNARTHRRQGLSLWYRRKIENRPKSLAELIQEPVERILPEVGDWVKVTRPENWRDWKDPLWQKDMHQYDGKIFQIGNIFEMSVGERVRLKGVDWFFHRDWLTPAKPPEPEYREPVLPADAGQPCEFSITGKDWYSSLLAGFQVHNNPWISSDQGRWNFARIKKDA